MKQCRECKENLPKYHRGDTCDICLKDQAMTGTLVEVDEVIEPKKQTKKTRVVDPTFREIDTIRAVVVALKGLDGGQNKAEAMAAQQRVLEYAAQVFVVGPELKRFKPVEPGQI